MFTMCYKVPYETEEEAIKASEEIRKKVTLWYPTTPYKCANCKKWHMTHGSGYRCRKQRARLIY